MKKYARESLLGFDLKLLVAFTKIKMQWNEKFDL